MTIRFVVFEYLTGEMVKCIFITGHQYRNVTTRGIMKNGLAEPAIVRIANVLESTLIEFNKPLFLKEALRGLNGLELKQRVHHIINALHQIFPSDFKETAYILHKMKSNWDYGCSNDRLRAFAAWPVVDYVAVYGLEHPKESLDVLKNLTSLFSAEFAIRPFITKFPHYCMQQFSIWVEDESENVRRLVSEGTRPRLPWGEQLKQFIDDPRPNIPLLDALKNDKSLYVRRSVANHLNDIAKDDEALVIETCKLWQTVSNTEEVHWIIKHASRTLIKKGNADAFALLGYTEAPLIRISDVKISKTHVAIGQHLNFSFNVSSKARKMQHLVVDYAMYFVKANGQKRAKVFKLRNIKLNSDETLLITKSHSFKAISTRKYYPGMHRIEILVNGISFATTSFHLE